MVVRQVLNQLAADGLVVIEPYKGASVAVVTIDQIYETFSAVAMLEGYSAKLAAENITDDGITSPFNHFSWDDKSNLWRYVKMAIVKLNLSWIRRINDIRRRIIFTLILLFIAFFETNILAAPLFQINVTSEGSSYTQTYNTADDLTNDVKVENIIKYIPSYTDASAASGILRFRGIPMTFSYPQDSAALVLDVPSIGLHKTFDGETRNDSVELLKDWFKKSGSDEIKKLMQEAAKSTPNDPIAGNPSSLASKMVANSFNQGFVDKVSLLSDPASLRLQPAADSGERSVNANLIALKASYGRYTNDDAKIDSYTVPLSYIIRSNNDERMQLTASLPLTWNKYNSANSYAAGLGFAFSLPITGKTSDHQWILTPSIDYGATGSIDMYSGGQLVQGGITSSYTYHAGAYRFSMGNAVTYQRSFSVTISDVAMDPGVSNTVFRNGLMVSIPTSFLLSGSVIELFVIDTRFTGNELYSNYSDEFGIAWGFTKRGADEKKQDNVKMIRNVLTNVRVGASYLTSKGNKGFTMNMGWVF